MKYALVLIPLRDDRNLDELQVDYQVLEKDGDDYFESCVAEDTAAPLIPLPKKFTDWVTYDYEHELEEVVENANRAGWNECIEYILKGVE